MALEAIPDGRTRRARNAQKHVRWCRMNLPTPHLGDFAPPEVSTPLSEEHQKMLFEESAIQPEVAAVRGYWTATRRTDVPEVFPEWQRKRGLVIPIYSPDGETTSYQLKPYKPTIRKGKTR